MYNNVDTPWSVNTSSSTSDKSLSNFNRFNLFHCTVTVEIVLIYVLIATYIASVLRTHTARQK